MCSRSKSSRVRKIPILRNQKTSFALSCLPNLWIRFAAELLIERSLNIMTDVGQDRRKSRRHVLVEFDPHRI